ncbi:putative ABC transporter permease [Scatolibacter rhodanostii]|uniref:putative ABC transporter permease n=1 Tax=Scatolibacter rhodanostii TaxID=2014781 RepID=UPI001FA91FF6|nr:putative ABC transporter permease [Scatolibacter rhodanostii]
MMKKTVQKPKTGKNLFFFCVGFMLYITIEVIWRGYSHWTMGLLGGFCFLLIGSLNEIFPWEMDLLLQVLVAVVMITLLELTAGLILNIWMGLGIWDYTNLPGNFLGQISVLYSILWIPLSFVAIFLDDLLRYYLFNEEKPCYQIFKHPFCFFRQ